MRNKSGIANKNRRFSTTVEPLAKEVNGLFDKGKSKKKVGSTSGLIGLLEQTDAFSRIHSGKHICACVWFTGLDFKACSNSALSRISKVAVSLASHFLLLRSNPPAEPVGLTDLVFTAPEQPRCT